MKVLNLKLKPRRINSETKDGLISKIVHDHAYTTVNGTLVLINRDRDTIRLYNMQKYNRKSEQIKHKSGENKGRTKRSVVARYSFWEAHVYDIPLSLIKDHKIKIAEYKRHFKLIF